MMPSATAERPKQERGQVRRALLVESASELFLERGYEATSLDEIIARAGGSRRNVYEWFGGKEALFAAVVESARVQILDSLIAPDLTNVEPRTALISIGKRFMEALSAPRMLGLYRVIVAEGGRFPELGRVFFNFGPKQGYERLAANLRAWNAQGKISVRDPDVAARLLLEMMKGDMHMRLLFEPENPPDAETINIQVEMAADIILHGIAMTSGETSKR
jgi:AcrR family transcriptional regulator